jgi:hypothetical protein
MTSVRRLVLIVSIVVSGSLALALVATAAGASPGPVPGGKGGGPLGPGQYSFTDTSASATFGAPTAKGGIPQFLISVDRNVSSFQPDEGQDTATKGTTVTIQVTTPAITGFGCFTIDPSNFTVSKDLQTAALHTTLSTPCPGKPSGSGLPASIRLDITWAGNGVVGNSRHTDNFDCAGYATSTKFAAHAAGNTASGSVTLQSVALWPQGPADASTLQSSETHTHISGLEQASCIALQFVA